MFYLRKIIAISIIILSVLTFQVWSNEPEAESKPKIILIDAGHGGVDGGAVSPNGTIEKNITLDISLKLKQELMIRDYKIVMTREKDEGLYSEGKKTIRQKKNEDLNNRCKMKEDSACDLFVSIHTNMFQESKYKGAQVWYANNEESKKFASILMKNLREGLDKSNNRVEKVDEKNIKVLRCNKNIASVIVECGFLSNPTEEKLLLSEEYQYKIVEVISNSIDEYFGKK